MKEKEQPYNHTDFKEEFAIKSFTGKRVGSEIHWEWSKPVGDVCIYEFNLRRGEHGVSALYRVDPDDLIRVTHGHRFQDSATARIRAHPQEKWGYGPWSQTVRIEAVEDFNKHERERTMKETEQYGVIVKTPVKRRKMVGLIQRSVGGYRHIVIDPSKVIAVSPQGADLLSIDGLGSGYDFRLYAEFDSFVVWEKCCDGSHWDTFLALLEKLGIEPVFN